MKQIRQNSANSLEAQTKLLKLPELQIIARFMIESAQPLLRDFLRAVRVQSAGQEQAAEYVALRSVGKAPLEVCQEIVGTTCSWDVLSRFGFGTLGASLG